MVKPIIKKRYNGYTNGGHLAHTGPVSIPSTEPVPRDPSFKNEDDIEKKLSLHEILRDTPKDCIMTREEFDYKVRNLLKWSLRTTYEKYLEPEGKRIDNARPVSDLLSYVR